MSKDKGNKSVNKKTILRILKYIKRYRFLVVLSLICAAISVVLTLYAPIIMGHAVDRVVGPGKVDFTGLKGMLEKLVIVVVITAGYCRRSCCRPPGRTYRSSSGS